MGMVPNTLISATELSALIAEPNPLLILDARHQLADKAWGRQAYEVAHIRGAQFIDLETESSGEKNGRNGRHPLPTLENFQRILMQKGLRQGMAVVIYDQDNGMMAARVWWMIRHWVGYGPCAVLDGGFRGWQDSGGAISQVSPPTHHADLAVPTFNPHPERVVDVSAIMADGLAQGTSPQQFYLIDARSPERYRGEQEPIDKVAGHIPHARNHFCGRNINSLGGWKSAAALHLEWQDEVEAAKLDGRDIVHQCGSGVTACHNWLAMEHAGFNMARVRLYAGSWSEYCADSARPIARGSRGD